MDDQTFLNQLAEKLSKLGTIRPLGFHYLHPYGTVPADSIICNGATYSRALYKDFFDYITTQGWVKTEAEWQQIALRDNGFCPFYSSGDDSTNFRTPKFAAYQQIATTSASVGKYHHAGIPNIVGEHNGTPWISEGSGCFKVSDTTDTIPNGNYNSRDTVIFDASLCNPIYGRSATVQPESNEWAMCVVAYGIATNVGSVDIQNVMSAVNTVQASLENTVHIAETWKSTDGMGWYRKWSDGFIEQGGRITSPTTSISLHTAFKTTNYTISVSQKDTSSANIHHVSTTARTTSKFTLDCCESAVLPISWHACGY